MSSLMYVNGTRIVYTGKRNDFSAATKLYFKEKKNKDNDICHRVSYRFMADAITNAVNWLIDEIKLSRRIDVDNLVDEAFFYVLGIVLATCTRDEQLSQLIKPDEYVLENKNDIKQKKEIFKTIINTIWDTDQDDLEGLLKEFEERLKNYAVALTYGLDGEGIANLGVQLTQKLEELLDRLNNSIPNLFLGSSSWNRSIGECFDPRDGIIDAPKTYEIKGVKQYVGALSLCDSAVFSILVEGTKPGGPKYDESELSVWAGVDEKEEIILYSSSQKGLLPEVDKLGDNVIIVYYNCFRKKLIPILGDLEDDEEFMTGLNSDDMLNGYMEAN